MEQSSSTIGKDRSWMSLAVELTVSAALVFAFALINRHHDLFVYHQRMQKAQHYMAVVEAVQYGDAVLHGTASKSPSFDQIQRVEHVTTVFDPPQHQYVMDADGITVEACAVFAQEFGDPLHHTSINGVDMNPKKPWIACNGTAPKHVRVVGRLMDGSTST